MTIQCAFTPDGGFVASDPDSGLTSYAVAASPFAISAKLDPSGIAARMIAGEQWRTHPDFAEYDARNVRRLALALYLDSTYKGGNQ